MRAAVAALVLLVPVLAGCAAPPGRATDQGGAPDGTATSTTAPTVVTQTLGTRAPVGPTTTAAPSTENFGLGKADLQMADRSHTAVLLRTMQGCLAAELFDDKAPRTVENFKAYVTEGFYTGVQCYRIITGFVNQCGGGSSGKEGSRPPIPNEAVASGLRNDRYTLAMARQGATCPTCQDQPDSATTEFYVNAADNCFLDPKSTSRCPQDASTDAGYAVFGILVAGREVSDRINQMQGKMVPLESVTVLA